MNSVRLLFVSIFLVFYGWVYAQEGKNPQIDSLSRDLINAFGSFLIIE